MRKGIWKIKSGRLNLRMSSEESGALEETASFQVSLFTHTLKSLGIPRENSHQLKGSYSVQLNKVVLVLTFAGRF